MKKIIYLASLLTVVAFTNTSCEKESVTPNTPVVTKTLEELYPEWSNLTWVSTKDKNDKNVNVPKLSIKIEGDVATITTVNISGNETSIQYRNIDLLNGNITFYTKKDKSYGSIYYTFTDNNDGFIVVDYMEYKCKLKI